MAPNAISAPAIPPSPPRRTSADAYVDPNSTPRRPTSTSTSTSKSNRSSITSKSPGSSPRNLLLLGMLDPSPLSLADDPHLDMDFELLFIHEDTSLSPKTSTRPKPARAKTNSTFTEHWTPKNPDPPAGRRDWSTFTFSHYGATAVGLRGKGRVGEMYVKNKAELGR